jgi:hypothetical protein
MRHRLIGLLFFLVALPLAAADLSPQTSALGGVTLKATPRSLSDPVWRFEIVFDTHTQNLADDVAKSSVLIADGAASYAPLQWQGEAPGGHHRKGVLSFKPISPAPRAIELRIQRAGEAAPRSFRWELH